MVKWLEGRKTIIVAVFGGFVLFLWMSGAIDEKTASTILEFLGAGTLLALRSGVQSKGWKTYASGAGMIGVSILKKIGIVTPELATGIYGILGSAGIGFLRHGISKIIK